MMTLADLEARGSLLINDGYRTKKDELGEPGFPVLRVAEIGDGHVAPSYGDHVRIEYQNKIGYKLSRPGDVLLTTKGTVGRRAIMPDLGTQFAYSPQLCFFRALDESIDPRWLYYWLASDNFWGQAAGVSQQTDMAPYISLRDLRAIRIEVPNIEDQHAVAETLGALDDKISSNYRAVQISLALLDAMFDAACLLHSSLVAVGDLATFHNRRRVPLSSRQREEHAGPYPYYGATGVFGFVDDFLFDETLVLVGEDGSVVNSDGTPVTQYIWGKSWINNHAHPLTGVGVSTELLFIALRRVDVRPIVTGAVQAKISMGSLRALEVVLPSGTACALLEEAIQPLFAMHRQKVDESAKLISIRDTLLPELLSGRIRVPNGHVVA